MIRVHSRTQFHCEAIRRLLPLNLRWRHPPATGTTATRAVLGLARSAHRHLGGDLARLSISSFTSGQVVRTVSGLTPVRWLCFTQHRLTKDDVEFITSGTPDGAPLRPLPSEINPEQTRREVRHV